MSYYAPQLPCFRTTRPRLYTFVGKRHGSEVRHACDGFTRPYLAGAATCIDAVLFPQQQSTRTRGTRAFDRQHVHTVAQM